MKAMLVLILDRSGSMGGRESDVIGGVNKFLVDQRAVPGEAVVAMVRFDSEAIERFRPMGPLEACLPLTLADYQPRGGTPLLDAVGRTIVELDEDWKREQPERCIVVIVTDGHENASKEYKRERIKQMIESREKSGLWSFMYLGANVDAFEEGSSLGIHHLNTAQFTSSAAGTASLYGATSAAVGMMRSTGAQYASNLGREIAEDEGKPPKPTTAPLKPPPRAGRRGARKA